MISYDELTKLKGIGEWTAQKPHFPIEQTGCCTNIRYRLYK